MTPTCRALTIRAQAIEGTNCTFLEALWTAGGNWQADDGTVTVDSDAGQTALAWYDETLSSGITKPGIAEETTDLSRQAFQAGDVVFMLNWGYAWAHFQEDDDSEGQRCGRRRALARVRRQQLSDVCRRLSVGDEPL